jgi:CAAX protease family protein
MGSTSEPIAPPAARSARPPVWTSLLAPLLAFLASALASGTAVAVLALLSDPTLKRANFQEELQRWIEESSGSFPTILSFLVPAQMCFLGVAIFFAILEREPILPRLGLVRWKASGSTVGLAVVGSLGVQFLIDLVAESWIDEPSDSIRMLTRMFLEPQGLAAVGVGFLMTVLPGSCEEALFRGFTQRGLLRRWSPVAAIGATSVLFALAHWDVQHSIAVFPLGVWFGYVAWRTGSVWPAVLCHFTNNLAAFVVVRIWGDANSLDMPKGFATYAVGFGLVAVTIVAILRLGGTDPARDLAQSLAPPMNR